MDPICASFHFTSPPRYPVTRTLIISHQSSHTGRLASFIRLNGSPPSSPSDGARQRVCCAVDPSTGGGAERGVAEDGIASPLEGMISDDDEIFKVKSTTTTVNQRTRHKLKRKSENLLPLERNEHSQKAAKTHDNPACGHEIKLH